MSDPRVIVIGGSAGALDTLLAILPALPARFAIPVVVVVHLAPNSASLVPALLERATSLHVVEIEDKQPLMRATIHVAPPNYHVLLERDGTLALSIDELVHFSRPSIDVVFESAARAFGGDVVAVLLSGANEDGASGLRRIVEAGGLAFVQDPSTAHHAIMPAAGIAELRGRGRILVPGRIAECLTGLVGDYAVAEHAR
ncbi:MAG TPA: chemotaxis protein CheB [Kofleriaceae bacterium]|jgi:two-component system chemotaxis response regulator CheB|nr:chemotaxis protein CheB [Kofleriaceae bacterium]